MTETQIKRLQAIDRLENFYLKNFAEDGQDGTDFDNEVLDALEDLREWVHPSTEAELA